jgi:hypothetical protein
MAKKSKVASNLDKLPDARDIKAGDRVMCIELSGLQHDIMMFIESKDEHFVEKVISAKGDPIYYLVGSPTIDGINPYPFMNDRFIKV